jgi:hypothetical protein
MFYCKNCYYSLEITKNQAQETDVTRVKTLAGPADLVRLVLKDKKYDPEVQLAVGFSEAALKEHLHDLGDLTEDQQNAVIGRFQQIIKHQQNTSHFYFICNNCSTSYVLQPGTTLYSINFDKSSTSLLNEDVDMKVMDPILPRTKDYICPNKTCATHKQTGDKEAVFYRSGKDYRLKYICCACRTQWNV